MKCPNDNSSLSKVNYKGIEVDKCPECSGMWFDTLEVDELEDRTLPEDEFKNTMITNVEPSDKICPKCDSKMHSFDYRWEDLQLEACPNKHGFWVDAKEEKRITELMEKRIEEMERKYEVEDEWDAHLNRLRRNSVIDRIVEFFK